MVGMAPHPVVSAGVTGSTWHHLDNGHTDLYYSQDSNSAVKMQTVSKDGGYEQGHLCSFPSPVKMKK